MMYERHVSIYCEVSRTTFHHCVRVNIRCVETNDL